eukprot:TRINITY_DN6654_c0_g1_i1.p1 TRINITY_DN6654_c0_g1~~TRINITY_DN6654_c0_g1_i1.p1  ORF type:complete len:490 (+),score=90.73 TRINITY_DN6654_c0_g1_i1:164-1633(+)
MQQLSPNISGISSPSSFISPRASPLLGTPAEQGDPLSCAATYDFPQNNNPLPQIAGAAEADPEHRNENGSNSSGEGAAPPKQVALAMERLAQAGWLIAQLRICADRLVDAIFRTSSIRNADPSSSKWVQVIAYEEGLLRKYLEELRILGRTLESSGVLIGALQKIQETPGWGLHMPLVCPDGAVVAYAWKRQLAGQAAASAVDRTRLALKAFTDQKRHFFPHLEDDMYAKDTTGDLSLPKKQSLFFPMAQKYMQDALPQPEEHTDLLNVLKTFEVEGSTLKISMYSRLEWYRKGSFIHAASRTHSAEVLVQDQNSPLQTAATCEANLDSATTDAIGVLDVLIPSVLRAIVSLTPAGSITPDAVAVFSVQEVGSHIHAKGTSVHNVFKQVSRYADKALQYFLHVCPHSSLKILLHWLCTYQSLFTKCCSKCGQILAMDWQSTVVLPPVIRPYQHFYAHINTLSQPLTSIKQQSTDEDLAFHVGCISEEEL